MSAGRTAGWISAAASAALGLGLAVVLLRVGAHATGDSGGYARYAAALAGAGGEISALWPPLYPALLALLGAALPVDTLDAAALINGAAAAVGLGSAVALGRAAGLGPVGAPAAALALAFTPAVQGVFLCAWSEGLAAAALLLHLAAGAAALRAPTRAAPWALAALGAAALSMTRYAGALAPVALLVVALATRRLRPALWAAAAHLPLALWLGAQRLRTGHATGARRPATLSLSENVGFLFDDLDAILDVAPAALPLAGAALLGGGLALARSGADRRVLLFGALHVAGAAGMLLWATSTVAMDRINPRLSHPVVLSIWALLVIAAGAGARGRGGAAGPGGPLFGAALLWSALAGPEVGAARAAHVMRGAAPETSAAQGGWRAGPGPVAFAAAVDDLAPAGVERWALSVASERQGAAGSWALLHRRPPGAPPLQIRVRHGGFRAEGRRGPVVLLTPSGRMDRPGIAAALAAHAPAGAPGLLLLTPRAARQAGLPAGLSLGGWSCAEGAHVGGLRAWRCGAAPALAQGG
ncbi:MAG: hypothetical protein RL071_3293 [Pseudomonadota bacterium]